ncbi:MAG: hypothetical protein ABI306_09090 [Caulobacteraceae bacterium]
MIPRFLSRSQWEKKLKGLGAAPLAGLTPLNTAEWWRIPGRPPFTVPIEGDGRADFWAIQKLCEQIGAPPIFDPPLTPDD